MPGEKGCREARRMCGVAAKVDWRVELVTKTSGAFSDAEPNG